MINDINKEMAENLIKEIKARHGNNPTCDITWMKLCSCYEIIQIIKNNYGV